MPSTVRSDTTRALPCPGSSTAEGTKRTRVDGAARPVRAGAGDPVAEVAEVTARVLELLAVAVARRAGPLGPVVVGSLRDVAGADGLVCTTRAGASAEPAAEVADGGVVPGGAPCGSGAAVPQAVSDPRRTTSAGPIARARNVPGRRRAVSLATTG